MALRKIKVDSLIGSPVSVYFNSEYSEYVVRIKGNPAADYFTGDKRDALQTAQMMRNNIKGFIMARKSRKMQYVARSGAKQWKPSIEYAMVLSENYEGFCLACGAAKVYGALELALMGLVF